MKKPNLEGVKNLLFDLGGVIMDIRREFEKDSKHREDYFDGICTSFEEGVAKPDRRIFEAVVRKFGIRPEETLFFDDSQTNLDAASQLGFKTWLVAEGTEFMEAFGE